MKVFYLIAFFTICVYGAGFSQDSSKINLCRGLDTQIVSIEQRVNFGFILKDFPKGTAFVEVTVREISQEKQDGMVFVLYQGSPQEKYSRVKQNVNLPKKDLNKWKVVVCTFSKQKDGSLQQTTKFECPMNKIRRR